MLTRALPRVSIAHLPTPLEILPRLTVRLGGPELWIKRDDQTGLATGGNKARKLEFLVADALAQEGGCDTLITCGAAQSNHARQTAAAAAKLGLDCWLVLRGSPPSQWSGNLLLDHLLGAHLVWAGDTPPGDRMIAVATQLEGEGRRPYTIPYGGSSPLGAAGYVAALEELLTQCAAYHVQFDYIVLASSSGGTQAGLVVAARALGYSGRIIGVSVDLRSDALRRVLSALATATAGLLGLGMEFAPQDFIVNDDYLGSGYGVVGELERAAIHTLARTEGILLDPVYTGRAFGGLLDMIRRGTFNRGERILFWHTGGTAGLFGYAIPEESECGPRRVC
ncbi:MAG: D-cysteine desulfhydrase family protein [Anaerolineae bacterium]|nr:D-cysteine desulfhydrase family protein [Anaerolineae bacterium]